MKDFEGEDAHSPAAFAWNFCWDWRGDVNRSYSHFKAASEPFASHRILCLVSFPSFPIKDLKDQFQPCILNFQYTPFRNQHGFCVCVGCIYIRNKNARTTTFGLFKPASRRHDPKPWTMKLILHFWVRLYEGQGQTCTPNSVTWERGSV